QWQAQLGGSFSHAWLGPLHVLPFLHLPPEELKRERLRYWIHEAKEHQNIFCVIYDAADKVYERTEELAASSVPGVPASPQESPSFENATVEIVGRQRVLM